MSAKSILIACLLINPLITACGSEPENSDVVKTEKSAERKMHEVDEFRVLKKHTEYKDIINQFGEPDAVVGRGFLIIEYHMRDGKKVVLNFAGGNKLEALYVLSSDGKEREYIIEP